MCRPYWVRLSTYVPTISNASTIGTTYGTPEITMFALGARLRVIRSVATAATRATPPTLNSTSGVGCVTNPRFSREKCLPSITAAKPPAPTTKSSQLPTVDRLPLATSLSTVAVPIPSVPPCPMNCRMTPCQTRNSASVTTNEGIPILETRNPVRQPIAVPTQTASNISSHALAAAPESTITTANAESAAP